LKKSLSFLFSFSHTLFSLPFISPTLYLSPPPYLPMTLSENDQHEESYMRFQSNMNRPPSKANASSSSTPHMKKKRTSSHSYSTNNNTHASTPQTNNPTNSNEFSWPILLAIVPTLGTFFAGSAEIWSDFVMILLILYYVYKWMTGKTLGCLLIQ
jgi:hypothetical protein